MLIVTSMISHVENLSSVDVSGGSEKLAAI
jgi:hypothetical protein